MAVAVGLAAGALSSCGAAGTVAPPSTRILVVGDSLVVAASADLTRLSPSAAGTTVLAGVGASPCDIWAGYRATPPFGDQELSFTSAVHSVRPTVVVLAFSGNPGISGHACIADPGGMYTLSALAAAYLRALTAMGEFAAARGARIVLSATPARNPAVPEGWQDGSQHGFNGDPALNTMLSGLADTHGWTYDTGAASAISGPGLSWTLTLPCRPTGGVLCVDGREQVRYGGPDAIHCDAPGANGTGSPSDGSLRFATGLLTGPLGADGLHPRNGPGAAPTTTTGRHCGAPAARNASG